MNNLYIFVEGMDDKRFIDNIIYPTILKYFNINIVSIPKNFIKKCRAKNEKFIFFI